MPKEYKPMEKAAKEQGWEITPTRGGHIMWKSPEGRKVFCPSTPSDRRSLENVKRKLKHGGLKL